MREVTRTVSVWGGGEADLTECAVRRLTVLTDLT